ncbi:hypothetical protein DPMN_164148 [Dreissena polymorpha]|uniref:Uncharacterized protein n=1 Tax=Dreissena polymorpha TaxID=45954 RepID=A0A9D4EY45_DREPO|nr:hypothetical protein DPMN_164148 [Dreissena polymorpha]
MITGHVFVPTTSVMLPPPCVVSAWHSMKGYGEERRRKETGKASFHRYNLPDTAILT